MSLPTEHVITTIDELRTVYRRPSQLVLDKEQAVIDDALEGKYLSAKFLFETVGLCAMSGDDLENPERKESLTSLLLKRWQLAPPSAKMGAENAAEVTEVPDSTTVVGSPVEAPVES